MHHSFLLSNGKVVEEWSRNKRESNFRINMGGISWWEAYLEAVRMREATAECEKILEVNEGKCEETNRNKDLKLETGR